MALSTNLKMESISGSDLVNPKPIDDNFKIVDKLGLDYITEQGLSGFWLYRKWNSGFMELWARIDFPATTSVGPVSSGFSFPFPFSKAPVVTLSAGVEGRTDAYLNYVNATANSVDCYISKGSSSSLTRWVYCYAAGVVK